MGGVGGDEGLREILDAVGVSVADDLGGDGQGAPPAPPPSSQQPPAPLNPDAPPSPLPPGGADDEADRIETMKSYLTLASSHMTSKLLAPPSAPGGSPYAPPSGGAGGARGGMGQGSSANDPPRNIIWYPNQKYNELLKREGAEEGGEEKQVDLDTVGR